MEEIIQGYYQEIINKANRLDPHCDARAVVNPAWGKYRVSLKMGEGYGSECMLVGGMSMDQAEEVAKVINKRKVVE